MKTGIHFLRRGILGLAVLVGANLPQTVADASVLPSPPSAVSVSASLNGTYYTNTLLILWSPAVVPVGTTVTSYTVNGDGQQWTGVSANWLVVPNLRSGRAYNFCVIAVTTAGNSACSATVTATAVGIPGTPYNVVARPGDSQSVVSWTPSPYDSGLAVTSYLVTDNAGDTCRTTTTSCTLTGLHNGTSYTVSVAAINAVGPSSGSTPVTVAISAVTPPSAPQVVSWSTANGNLTVNWSLPTNDGGWPVTNTVVALNGRPACDSPGLSCTVWMLPVGSIQSIQVFSQNAVGSGAWSSPVTAQVGNVPAAPSFAYTAAGFGEVALTWSNPPSNYGLAITSYTVTDGLGHSCTVPGTQMWCVIMNLRPGTPVSFSMTATNVLGTSTASAPVVLTPIGIAGSPTNLSATVTSGSVTLNFLPSTWTGGTPTTAYVVTASTGAQCQSATTSCTFSGLASGSSVSFIVVAQNAAGNSPPSLPITVTVP